MTKLKKALLALLCVMNVSLFSADLPAPYKNIKVLPEYPFSYYFNSKEIAEIFQDKSIKVVIEVGSWIGGGSTRHMGEMLKERNGTLYAVDHWLGSTTQQPNEPHWQPVLDHVYQQFLSNMIHWKLTDVVVPCRMKSLEAAKALNVKPDLIYIDGEHTEEAVYDDLVAWYPLVESKGIICGDDWLWTGVDKAVMRFAEENDLRVEVSYNFWRLSRND